MKRNNKVIGDSLQTLLLGRRQEEQNVSLPQLMKAYRGTHHTATEETANVLMLGGKLRLPDQLQHKNPLSE